MEQDGQGIRYVDAGCRVGGEATRSGWGGRAQVATGEGRGAGRVMREGSIGWDSRCGQKPLVVVGAGYVGVGEGD